MPCPIRCFGGSWAAVWLARRIGQPIGVDAGQPEEIAQFGHPLRSARDEREGCLLGGAVLALAREHLRDAIERCEIIGVEGERLLVMLERSADVRDALVVD